MCFKGYVYLLINKIFMNELEYCLRMYPPAFLFIYFFCTLTPLKLYYYWIILYVLKSSPNLHVLWNLNQDKYSLSANSTNLHLDIMVRINKYIFPLYMDTGLVAYGLWGKEKYIMPVIHIVLPFIIFDNNEE